MFFESRKFPKCDRKILSRKLKSKNRKVSFSQHQLLKIIQSFQFTRWFVTCENQENELLLSDVSKTILYPNVPNL